MSDNTSRRVETWLAIPKQARSEPPKGQLKKIIHFCWQNHMKLVGGLNPHYKYAGQLALSSHFYG